MAFVVCIVPVCPMRREANHRSEMVSELLFGEIAEVLEEESVFTKIRCSYDGYEGWCQNTQLTHIETNQFDPNNKCLTADWVNTGSLNGYPVQLPLGASLGILQNGRAQIGNFEIAYKGRVHDPEKTLFTEQMIRAVSSLYMNTGYLWGGRSVYGIDCSGFVQQVFRFFNKQLPRDAYQQAEQGESIGFLQEVKCGDLAFFDNAEGKITHVGILWNSNTIIHASGKVRVDPIDNLGVISSDSGVRTHHIRIIKRYA